jgi:hypothetical protein
MMYDERVYYIRRVRGDGQPYRGGLGFHVIAALAVRGDCEYATRSSAANSHPRLRYSVCYTRARQQECKINILRNGERPRGCRIVVFINQLYR